MLCLERSLVHSKGPSAAIISTIFIVVSWRVRTMSNTVYLQNPFQNLIVEVGDQGMYVTVVGRITAS